MNWVWGDVFSLWLSKNHAFISCSAQCSHYELWHIDILLYRITHICRYIQRGFPLASHSNSRTNIFCGSTFVLLSHIYQLHFCQTFRTISEKNRYQRPSGLTERATLHGVLPAELCTVLQFLWVWLQNNQSIRSHYFISDHIMWWRQWSSTFWN